MTLYKHSGAAPVPGLVMVLAGALAVGLGLGFAYGYLMPFIPFVYINLLITIVYAAGLGATVAYVGKAGKIRNTLLTGVIGLVAGAWGLYVAWAADMLSREYVDSFTLSPGVLLTYLGEFYDKGAWSIGSGKTNVTGIFLAIVWIIEAGIIVVSAALVAAGIFSDLPFCERCNLWTRMTKGLQRLSLTGAEGLVQRLGNGEIASLAEVERAGATDKAFLRIDLASCESCADSNYVTIAAVHTVVKDGKEEEKEEKIIRNMEIGGQDVELVRHAGKPMERPGPAAPPA